VDTGRQVTVTTVSGSFAQLQRTIRRTRARLLADAGGDVDSAAQLLLRTVASDGPLRASALAVSMQADLSTISRQVAGLVKRGLLERRADQQDGRASFLVVTEAGHAVIAEHEQRRQAFFEQVLAGWSGDELRQFAQQLDRFTAAYDQTHIVWMRERARAPGRDVKEDRSP
jgi:DNA-binding MarR family transcriptional regulator